MSSKNKDNFTPAFSIWIHFISGFPCGSAGKESACNAWDRGSILGLGRSPGEGKGYPLQYRGLENSIDCIAYRIIKSWTWLSDFHFHILFLLLDLMYWLELLVQVWLQLEWKTTSPPPILNGKHSVFYHGISMTLTVGFFCRCPLSGWENSFLFLIYQKYLSLMGTELFKQILCYTYSDFFLFYYVNRVNHIFFS